MNRVIVRTNLFELILEIILFLSGTFVRESHNLYPRCGRGSLQTMATGFCCDQMAAFIYVLALRDMLVFLRYF